MQLLSFWFELNTGGSGGHKADSSRCWMGKGLLHPNVERDEDVVCYLEQFKDCDANDKTFTLYIIRTSDFVDSNQLVCC